MQAEVGGGLEAGCQAPLPLCMLAYKGGKLLMAGTAWGGVEAYIVADLNACPASPYTTSSSPIMPSATATASVLPMQPR